MGRGRSCYACSPTLLIQTRKIIPPREPPPNYLTRHWSGKHHRVVQGINLISTIWTDGSAIVSVDFRIYCPDKDGKNKNDHFRDMLRAAEERKFQPGCVIFDSWYSSIANLKLIRTLKWHWCTRLKSNRLVDPDNTYNRSVSEIEIPPEGRVVHLRQYGFIKLFRIVHSDKEPEHWATDILDASETDRKTFKELGWNIEEDHRGIKQGCGIERCQGPKRGCSTRTYSALVAGISSPRNPSIEYRFQLVRVETLDSSIRFFSLYRFHGVLI
ncbi:MAG: hypothetical protein METHP_01730 [Methanoregula sp. SKADARSKE-2]|nr:MAG: hypothetical protein METHP_01730 [Methanoregula sp. SKADARSKE-2]